MNIVIGWLTDVAECYSANLGSIPNYAYFCSMAVLPMWKLLFWRKMFYSDNLLLSVQARSCNESAVADAYNISVFDLLHLDSSCFKNVLWDYFTSIAHL